MTFLVERVAELRRHVDHLHELAPRVDAPAALERNLSLHNDVMFSLLMVAQLVIDVAGELAARRGVHPPGEDVLIAVGANTPQAVIRRGEALRL